MNVKSKLGIISILIFSLLCSLTVSTAYVNIGNHSVTISNTGDNSSNAYAQLNGDGIIYPGDGKLPKNYEKYRNSTFQVSTGSKIKYKTSVISQGLLTNITGVKIKNSYINFGDGTKTTSNVWVVHTYKKSGWYKILISFNATFKNASFMGGKVNGTILGATKEYLVHVSTKPQLALNQISCGYNSFKNYKNKNVDYLMVKVANVGSAASKSTQIKIWYEQPNKIGAVYSKLKSYTKSATIKALKPGESTTVQIKFSIPHKYAKLWKDVLLDSLNKLNQFNKGATFYRLN
ncbi:MAG: hypothetical protein NKF70_02415 [Methanobacterium sp. ERen5]|nr:MAG: hypothetical protein NKF70_02415 [Methanobacterium sp. ERen5]